MDIQKNRRSNLGASQILKLISLVRENLPIIDGRHRGAGVGEVTKLTKKEVWKSIAAEVNVMDPLSPPRTNEELRKKWNDLRHLAVKYNTAKNGTGGGPPPKKPSFYEEVMDILSEKKTLLHGVPGIGNIPSFGWQGATGSDPSGYILADPFLTDTTIKQNISTVKASGDAVATADEHQHVLETTCIAEDRHCSTESTGASFTDSTQTMVTPKKKFGSFAEKRKRAKEVDDEPWGEYLRGKIRLNKIRERVYILQEKKLEKEIRRLDIDLGN